MSAVKYRSKSVLSVMQHMCGVLLKACGAGSTRGVALLSRI